MLAWLCLPAYSRALWASADLQGICDGIAMQKEGNPHKKCLGGMRLSACHQSVLSVLMSLVTALF